MAPGNKGPGRPRLGPSVETDFSRWLGALMARYDVKPAEIARLLEIDPSVVSKWLHDGIRPKGGGEVAYRYYLEHKLAERALPDGVEIGVVKSVAPIDNAPARDTGEEVDPSVNREDVDQIHARLDALEQLIRRRLPAARPRRPGSLPGHQRGR